MNATRAVMLLLVLLGTWMGDGSLSSAQEAASDLPAEAIEYMIVVTGGELLAGAFPDSHTVFLTRTLRPLGLNCVGSISVDDGVQDIQAALKFALARVRLVIVTGGLGPTQNDITRETLSKFHRHPAGGKRRGAGRHRAAYGHDARPLAAQSAPADSDTGSRNLPEKRERQLGRTGIRPRPARHHSPARSAGRIAADGSRFAGAVAGQSLRHASARRRVDRSLCRRRQSQIDQTMQEHIPLDADIIVQSQFESSRVDFTFLLPDDTPDSRARLDALRQQIQQHLGEYVYATGETTLESHVLKQLAARRQTLAVAEAGSGGCLASALAGADGADAVLAGAVIASDDERLGWLVEANTAASARGRERRNAGRRLGGRRRGTFSRRLVRGRRPVAAQPGRARCTSPSRSARPTGRPPRTASPCEALIPPAEPT
jgi:nicotinamide-nucleotide amidase